MSLPKTRDFDWSDWARAIFLLFVAGASGPGASLILNRESKANPIEEVKHSVAIARLESTDLYLLKRLDTIESKLDKIYEATRNGN